MDGRYGAKPFVSGRSSAMPYSELPGHVTVCARQGFVLIPFTEREVVT